jgi:putative flippase GtrA
MQQFIRFCIVGAFATLLDAALFYMFRQWMSYQASMVLSYTICLLLNMVLTLRWTFRRKFSLRNVMGVMWAHLFNLFVVRYKLMELFVVTLKMSDRLAYLPTLGISVVVNFLIIRAIVHKESPKDNG